MNEPTAATPPFTETLLRQSKHVKGPHGYSSLSRATGPATWHHNLWIHCDARNPRLGDYYGHGTPTFDVRNNVIYDYGALRPDSRRARCAPITSRTTSATVVTPSDLSHGAT